MRKSTGRASQNSAWRQPWLLISAVFLLSSIALYLTSFLPSDEAAEQALLSGQRVEISLATGEVYGGIELAGDPEEVVSEMLDALDKDASAEPIGAEGVEASQLETMDEPTTPINTGEIEPVESNDAVVTGALASQNTQADEVTPTDGGAASPATTADENTTEPEAGEVSNTTPDNTEIQIVQQGESQTVAPVVSSEIEVSAAPITEGKESAADADSVVVDASTSSQALQESQQNQQAQPVEAPIVEAANVAPSEQQLSDISIDAFSKELLEKRKDDITLSEGVKPIVIVISGTGLSVRTTERVLEMPVNYTVGFSPYAPDVAIWNKKAMMLGFDTLIHVPMETPDFSVDDPGPYAMMSTATGEENISRLEMLLSLGEGFKGVYSLPTENFSTNINNIRPVVAGLSDMRIPLLYGRGAGNVSLLQFTEQSNIRLILNDVTIDDEISYDKIMANLKSLENIAQQNNYAVGMARPYPLTLKTLLLWQQKLPKGKFMIVPFSQLLTYVNQRKNG